MIHKMFGTFAHIFGGDLIERGNLNMKTIRAGDVYFLKSPFKMQGGTDNTEVERRLCYLTGTVSLTPAVVIRPPAWWDRYNTCTVIPALAHGEPAKVLRMIDAYGMLSNTEYRFVPHNPHTIPVSRLGKYMGSLDPDELDDLMIAFSYIHDVSWKCDNLKKYTAPAMYHDVMNRESIPNSWEVNKDARANVNICIDENMQVQSDTNPELNGFVIAKADGRKATAIPGVDERSEDACLTSHAIHDTIDTSSGDSPKKTFPSSVFDYELLALVAGHFTIKCDYDSMKTRNPKVVTVDEWNRITERVISPDDKLQYQSAIDTVTMYYRTLHPYDAYLLMPRIPVRVLREMTGLSENNVIILKRLSNLLRDMTDTDYDERIRHIMEEEAEGRCREMEANKNTPPASLRVVDLTKPRAKTNASRQQHIPTVVLTKMKHYLNPKKVYDMPDDIAKLFVTAPMYVMKRYWVGQFDTHYRKAIAYYRDRFAQELEQSAK